MFDENGVKTEAFTSALPEMLGDKYYNDPGVNSEPTKVFDNIPDIKTMVNRVVDSQRQISKGEDAFTERLKGMVKIPTDTSSAEEIAAYRKARDVPDTADKYELPIPGTDEAGGFKVIADLVRASAFESGISGKAASAVWEKVSAALVQQNVDIEAKGLAALKVEEETLRTEHKEKYDAFIKDTDKTLTILKTGEAFSKLMKGFGIQNHPAVRNLVNEVSPHYLEGGTVLGGGGGESDDESGGLPSSYKYDDNGRPIPK